MFVFFPGKLRNSVKIFGFLRTSKKTFKALEFKILTFGFLFSNTQNLCVGNIYITPISKKKVSPPENLLLRILENFLKKIFFYIIYFFEIKKVINYNFLIISLKYSVHHYQSFPPVSSFNEDRRS